MLKKYQHNVHLLSKIFSNIPNDSEQEVEPMQEEALSDPEINALLANDPSIKQATQQLEKVKNQKEELAKYSESLKANIQSMEKFYNETIEQFDRENREFNTLINS
jgi:hypothetical protein